MFCPKCAEAKSGDETIYCTRCGFDLSGIDAVVVSGGLGDRKRRKGIGQGVKPLMLGLLLIPVWMFIGAAFPPADRLVESSPSTTWAEGVAWILMLMAFVAGVSRIAYALLFERAAGINARPGSIDQTQVRDALPSGDSFKPAAPGKWKTTDDLLMPVARTSGEL